MSPQWSAERFIAALADERKRLGRLRLEGNADRDVVASLALSVGELRRDRRELADRWHKLAVFPSSFDTAAARAVWGQTEGQAHDALSRSMVLYDPAQQRWRLHDRLELFRSPMSGNIEHGSGSSASGHKRSRTNTPTI